MAANLKIFTVVTVIESGLCKLMYLDPAGHVLGWGETGASSDRLSSEFKRSNSKYEYVAPWKFGQVVETIEMERGRIATWVKGGK